MTRREEIDVLLQNLAMKSHQTRKDMAKARNGVLNISSTMDNLSRKLDNITDEYNKYNEEKLSLTI